MTHPRGGQPGDPNFFRNMEEDFTRQLAWGEEMAALAAILLWKITDGVPGRGVEITEKDIEEIPSDVKVTVEKDPYDMLTRGVFATVWLNHPDEHPVIEQPDDRPAPPAP
jgi:hypothetical protein